jgi:hypothetical protein
VKRDAAATQSQPQKIALYITIHGWQKPIGVAARAAPASDNAFSTSRSRERSDTWQAPLTPQQRRGRFTVRIKKACG